MKPTQDDNLLIQSYLTTAFLTELNNNNFLNSEYFKTVIFEDNVVKETLSTIGIDNQGTLLICLYTMLVVPRQLLAQRYPNDFEKLNHTVEQIKSDANSTYTKDSTKIDFIRHIRNSVAHARVAFVPGESVTFTDENRKGEKCEITIPLKHVCLFLTKLQRIFMRYIEDLKNSSVVS
ncbi:HEPN family nuclease [Desulfobacter sp.]|uniref:HEPN family nuclease n=1 Tax=Desulfobacter sp. TaxID=2294 RepID=UPI000E7DE387|nr:HEPN family nuclease [Desulfobacter sp.]HBT88461.1 hypothetical protein [Desulfobacter sp.]